jgi:hypothetical protein
MKKIDIFCCNFEISSKFTEPKIKKFTSKTLLIITSYDIICTPDLKHPRMAYFDNDDQPDINHAILKPKEHIIEKKILYSMSLIFSP